MAQVVPRRLWRRTAQLFNSHSKRQSSTATSEDVLTAAPETSRCPFQRAGRKLVQVFSKENQSHFRPYEDIPTPRGWPILGTSLDLMNSGGPAKIHEYCDNRHKELGPIFKEKLGTVEAVVISGANAIDNVYTSEGKHPVHMVPEPWLIYNELMGIKRGLFFMDGDQWTHRRKILNLVLINKVAVAKYGPVFNDVVTDLIERWRTISTKDEDCVLPNLEHELYNWSIESLGMMVFGRRLGCVQTPSDTNKMHDFVYYVQQIFTESAKMTMIPPRLAFMLKLPVWRRFVNAATNALEMARDYVEERIVEIHALQKSGQQVTGILSKLLAEKDIGHEEIVNIIADLILAAADTTSHATQWALYSLARHPECQEKLLNQIRSVVRPGELLGEHHLKRIPYVMWIIKETLRLYPIASFLTRVLPNDVLLEGYHVPAGKLILMSQYTIGRDPKLFQEPARFFPDRWVRHEKKEENSSKGCLPFGVGKRSCIGRRVAELQMSLLLARTVQKFHLEATNEKEVGIALRMITTPDEQIRLRLRERPV